MAAGRNRVPPRPRKVRIRRWDALETTLPLVYVAEFDRAGTFRYVSDVVEQGTGHTPAEFLADPRLWYGCLHPDDVDRVRNAEQLLFDSQGAAEPGVPDVGSNGEPRWVWERNTIVRDGRGVPMCTLGTSSTSVATGHSRWSRRRAQAALLFRRSFLTGLPTRQVLLEHLGLALARADRDGTLVALLDIDLDRFRGVNDAVGHAGGDVVLAQVANRLSDCVPPASCSCTAGPMSSW